MFRENNDHLQGSLFESTNWMNSGIKAKLNKSWAPIFYEYVFCNIDETPFSLLYSDMGRPNFPVNILLSLEFIKHMKNYSDDELIDNFNFNYLVNYAVGIRVLGELNLAEKTLYDFRTRIYQYLIQYSEQEDLIFNQFLNLTRVFIEKANISTDIQRMDSTMFMSNIKKAGRIALAFDVLYMAVKTIPEEKLTDELKEVLKPEFKTQTIYRSKPSEGESKLEMLLNLCLEAKNIIENISCINNQDTLRILTRFIKEQAIMDEETKSLKAKDNKDIPSNSLQSAYDEDATYRIKGGKGQSGYVLNIAETCSEDNPFQVITDYQVDQNIKSDVELLNDRLPEIKENTDLKDLYLDGGYYSDKVAELEKENQVELHFTNLSGRNPSKKQSVTDYQIDETTDLIVKCPKGYAPIHTGITKSQTVAHFPLTACSTCELRGKCHCKKQKKSYVVRINLKSVKTAKEREKILINRKENTSMRAAIEGTNSALKRGHNLSKLQVRGQVKSTTHTGFKVIAQNFKRFCNYMLEQSKKIKTKNQGMSVPVFT